ncbi:MAG: AMIN domain-containing protein, partial [Desulfovibrio sp.]|nr:AMIN domain-containing protein [Desulfovibrio sp.]
QGDWNVANAEIPKNPFITAVRVGKQNGTTRIVLDMKAEPKTVRVVDGKEKQSLDVRVDE